MTNKNNIKDSIHDFVDGNLSESQKDQLWAKLLGSPDDLDYLSTLATLKKMGKEGAFDTKPSAPETPFQLFRVVRKGIPVTAAVKPYLAAAAALIIGMAILFNLFTSADPVTEISPLAMIEYEIERSADDFTLFDNHLQQAVSYSSASDLDAALQELELAAAAELSESQMIDLKMVEGAVLYNSAEFSKAFEVFDSLKSTEGIDRQNLEKSIWYLANTMLQLGMIDEAEENIKKVIEMDGAFSRVANQKLEQL
jgi:tetratricopeptide (TPR) repeat protein